MATPVPIECVFRFVQARYFACLGEGLREGPNIGHRLTNVDGYRRFSIVPFLGAIAKGECFQESVCDTQILEHGLNGRETPPPPGIRSLPKVSVFRIPFAGCGRADLSHRKSLQGEPFRERSSDEPMTNR